MKDADKQMTKRQLIGELEALRRRIAELEQSGTDWEGAVEELQIAEQNFRKSIENSPLGICVVTSEGELLYANQAILDIYGYESVEELKTAPTKNRYTPTSYSEHQERVRKRELGKSVPSPYEISIIRKDGTVRHLVVRRKAVVWNGEIQFQEICQDLTDRRVTEARLLAIVDSYVSQYRERASQALQYYVQLTSLSDVIEKAVGQRHKEIISEKSLMQANSRLQQKAQEMSRCCSFADLYQLVGREIRTIRGIGDLVVYDIAHRIGAKLGLAPEMVYLHFGSKEVVSYLGLEIQNGTLPVTSFPKAFHRLNPDEIEDCLCIFKDSIRDSIKEILHRSS